jgi:hypothetical protein
MAAFSSSAMPVVSKNRDNTQSRKENRFYNEEVEKAKASPSFEREYNLECLGLIGNVQFFY